MTIGSMVPLHLLSASTAGRLRQRVGGPGGSTQKAIDRINQLEENKLKSLHSDLKEQFRYEVTAAEAFELSPESRTAYQNIRAFVMRLKSCKAISSPLDYSIHDGIDALIHFKRDFDENVVKDILFIYKKLSPDAHADQLPIIEADPELDNLSKLKDFVSSFASRMGAVQSELFFCGSSFDDPKIHCVITLKSSLFYISNFLNAVNNNRFWISKGL